MKHVSENLPKPKIIQSSFSSYQKYLLLDNISLKTNPSLKKDFFYRHICQNVYFHLRRTTYFISYLWTKYVKHKYYIFVFSLALMLVISLVPNRNEIKESLSETFEPNSTRGNTCLCIDISEQIRTETTAILIYIKHIESEFVWNVFISNRSRVSIHFHWNLLFIFSS